MAKRLEDKKLKENTSDNKPGLKEFQAMLHDLAHDIRNPLSGIRGFAELLQNDLAAQPNLQKLAALIIKGADNLNAMVDKALKNIDQYKE